MTLEDLTLTLFAGSNFLRLFAYVPQIRKAAVDQNGASAISYTTWSLFLLANLSTIAYGVVNRSDWKLAACFTANAVCCGLILGVAYLKRRSHARRKARPGSAAGDASARGGALTARSERPCPVCSPT